MRKYLLLCFLFILQGMDLAAEEPQEKKEAHYDLAVRTNLLHDALAIPNIGVEFYLAHRWSVATTLDYAWWSKHSQRRSWRYQGVEVDARHWFGAASARKPYTGHHLGLYGQCYTFDFAWGRHGYLGGESHGLSFERASYSLGLEYGYTLPLAQRLHLDLNIGVGYAGGRYYEYKTNDPYDIWQQTRQRHWVGPTKADVSLVWLFNTNGSRTKKGGRP